MARPASATALRADGGVVGSSDGSRLAEEDSTVAVGGQDGESNSDLCVCVHRK